MVQSKLLGPGSAVAGSASSLASQLPQVPWRSQIGAVLDGLYRYSGYLRLALDLWELACQRTAEQPPQTQPRRSRGTLWEQASRSRKGRKAAPKIYQTLKNTG